MSVAVATVAVATASSFLPNGIVLSASCPLGRLNPLDRIFVCRNRSKSAIKNVIRPQTGVEEEKSKKIIGDAAEIAVLNFSEFSNQM